MRPNSQNYCVSANTSVIQISHDIKSNNVWGRHHFYCYWNDIFCKHWEVFLFLKMGTRNRCWPIHIETSQLWGWGIPFGLFCFVFVTSYLYTGVHFHKCILNKCVDVWKRDLLNSWKREFTYINAFIKDVSENIAELLQWHLNFIHNAYLVAFYVKLLSMQEFVVLLLVQYYYEQWNSFYLFWKARTSWNIVFHSQVNLIKYKLLQSNKHLHSRGLDHHLYSFMSI